MLYTNTGARVDSLNNKISNPPTVRWMRLHRSVPQKFRYIVRNKLTKRILIHATTSINPRIAQKKSNLYSFKNQFVHQYRISPTSIRGETRNMSHTSTMPEPMPRPLSCPASHLSRVQYAFQRLSDDDDATA